MIELAGPMCSRKQFQRFYWLCVRTILSALIPCGPTKFVIFGNVGDGIVRGQSKQREHRKLSKVYFARYFGFFMGVNFVSVH